MQIERIRILPSLERALSEKAQAERKNTLTPDALSFEPDKRERQHSRRPKRYLPAGAKVLAAANRPQAAGNDAIDRVSDEVSDQEAFSAGIDVVA